MHRFKVRLGCDVAEGVGRSQSVIVVRDDLGVLETFANQFESNAETAQAICGLAQKWQIGDWMGPPTLRYQGNVDGPFRPMPRIGWGHPLSGTEEMWMAPFVLGTDGKFQVVLTKVRFKTAISEDEIDLESGFLMLPQAIPQPATGTEPPLVVPGGESPQPEVSGLTLPPGTTTPGGAVTLVKPAGEQAVDLMFDADRNQLFTAWNAIANLADLAGKVKETIRAESEKGFDRAKLQNGVMEPLREADLIE